MEALSFVGMSGWCSVEVGGWEEDEEQLRESDRGKGGRRGTSGWLVYV